MKSPQDCAIKRNHFTLITCGTLFTFTGTYDSVSFGELGGSSLTDTSTTFPCDCFTKMRSHAQTKTVHLHEARKCGGLLFSPESFPFNQ